MTTYSSKPTEVAMPVSSVYERVSNPAAFQERLDALPEEVRAKLGAVRFTEDSIIITAAPMGDMVLKITERVAESAPVPLIMSINLDAKTPESTEIVTAIDVEIPAMLRPMVGPKLQEAADKFGDMVKNLARS
jgi:hypothetical protein